LKIEDYEKNNNYRFVHNWLHQVDKYLAFEFKEEDFEQNKKNYYEMLSNEKANFFIGALFNGMIIASSNLTVSSYYKKETHIGRWGIVVHPDFQNKGLGTKLLKIIEQTSIEKGLIKLEAEFYDGNVNAEILYIEKLNYIIEGRRKCAALLNDGVYVDKILLGKIINTDFKKSHNL
jgi:ribosomal protein S18 acetylase RimI-like enzyme